MKPMPSPNGTNYAKFYIAGPVAAYDSVNGLRYDTPPAREDWGKYGAKLARRLMGMDESSPEHDRGQGWDDADEDDINSAARNALAKMRGANSARVSTLVGVVCPRTRHPISRASRSGLAFPTTRTVSVATIANIARLEIAPPHGPTRRRPMRTTRQPMLSSHKPVSEHFPDWPR